MAGQGYNSGSAYGGAVFNYNGTLSLSFVTVADNHAQIFAGSSGGNADGGGIYSLGDSVLHCSAGGNTCAASGALFTAGNSIVANNTAVTETTASSEISTGVINGGNDTHTYTNTLAAPQDLGTLMSGGGLDAVIVPKTGSAAIIDTVACSGAPATDQRGVERPQGTLCDIGAVEVKQSALTVTVVGGGAVSDTTSPAAVPVSGSAVTNCTASGGTCNARYDIESGAPTLTLTAAAPTNSSFAWSGAGCVSAPGSLLSTVLMDRARACTAMYTMMGISPATLVDGAYGAAYSASFSASGGSAPYSWTWVAAAGSSLPPGLTLNSIGKLSGTPSATGKYSFNVIATDAYGFTVTSLLSLNIVKDATTMTLTVDPNPARAGQMVTLTATVFGDPPTGSVVFYDGAAKLATSTLTPASAGSSVATFAISTLAPGTHSLSATYAGDANNQSSASAIVAVAVNSQPVPAPMLDRWALLFLCSLIGVVGLKWWSGKNISSSRA
jgi:hypothetical protein